MQIPSHPQNPTYGMTRFLEKRPGREATGRLFQTEAWPQKTLPLMSLDHWMGTPSSNPGSAQHSGCGWSVCQTPHITSTGKR